MTREEKSLLLQDLCARLPYGVCVHIRYKTGEPCYEKLTARDIQWFIDSKIEDIKPYLRPMSSMTEEEKVELWELLKNLGMTSDVKRLYWLLAHHFDIRNLIEKGLAIEAPEGMYNLKDK